MNKRPPPSPGTTPPQPASVPKILLANLYDAMALTGMMFVAALPWALLSDDGHVAAGSWPFQLYLLALINGYFCVSWCRGGQTLGMRAWRMRLHHGDGAPVSQLQAQIRFWVALVSWAAGGLGVLWGWSAGGSWHDRASGTRTVIYPKI